MNIRDPQRNVVIMNGDRILLANCRGPITDQPSGEVILNPSTTQDTFFVSCTYIRNGSTEGQLFAADCINAALVDTTLSLKDNFTLNQLMSAYQHPNATRRIPTIGNNSIKQESELIIYNRSKLLVNLEAVSFYP